MADYLKWSWHRNEREKGKRSEVEKDISKENPEISRKSSNENRASEH